LLAASPYINSPVSRLLLSYGIVETISASFGGMFSVGNTHSPTDVLAQKLFSSAQYVLVVVFGLLPVYFIPSANAPLVYSKTFLVVVGLLVALSLYSFSVLRTGTLKGYFPWALCALWGIVAAVVISALFSGDFRDALIGNGLESHTALFVGILALTATVWMLIGTSKAAVMRLYLLLAISTLLLALFHVSRIFFGADFLSFGIFGGRLRILDSL